jgi:hypothetical protein
MTISALFVVDIRFIAASNTTVKSAGIAPRT